MRVTNQMMAASMLYNVNQLRARTASLSDQISSGDRITKVSEDPTAGADVMRVQSRMAVMKQWDTNIGNTRNWVRATEAKLGDMTDILNQSKELALRAANGSMSAENRKELAVAAEALMQDLLAALNASEPEGALFAGFHTDIQAFSLDTATGLVTYTGDQGNVQRDVGPGVTMVANVHGDRLASNVPLGWGDPDNMLTTMWNLVEGLKTNDESRISATMGKLDDARKNVVALRSEMGARDVRMDQLELRLTDAQIQLEGMLEQAQGVDVAKAILDLNNADTTYRAALQVGARVMPQSLADFLR